LESGALVPRLLGQSESTARVGLVAGGALLLGGDRVAIRVSVGAGCTLSIEEIGGTVAYDADGVASGWHTEVTLERDAVLLWHGLPFVVADGSNVDRGLTVELGSGASACFRETIVLGRSLEKGGCITLTTSVRSSGRPVFLEHLALDGARPQPGVLGGARVLDSVLRVGGRAPSGAPDVPDVLDLEMPGSLARFLGEATHLSPLDDVWRSWSRFARESA
jgi:urease accessory protein